MIWNYVALLLTNRVGSLAKFGSPTECWALALSELHGPRQAAVTQMKLDWNRLVAAEKSEDLASDLRSTLDGPTRLMCLYYLFDGWSPNSAGGTTVLRTLLDCFPDSKIVEDCHQALRMPKQMNSWQALLFSRSLSRALSFHSERFIMRQ